MSQAASSKASKNGCAVSISRERLIVPICFCLSLPMATFSLVFISRIPPSTISEEWFLGMSLGEQIFSVSNTLAYLGVNTLFFSHLLPVAVSRLGSITLKTYDVLSNVVALILALSSALSFASLAYDGFSWGGIIIAGIASFCNFVAFGGTRYVGALNVIRLLRNNFFDQDFRFQQRLIRDLSLVRPEYKSDIEEQYLRSPAAAKATRKDGSLDEDFIKEFLHSFYSRASSAGTGTLLLSPSPTEGRQEFLQKWSASAFDVMFAGFMVYFIFTYFGQKGYEGINIFCDLLSGGKATIENLSPSVKQAIGFLPGASSAIFIFFSAFTLRHQCLKLSQIIGAQQDSRQRLRSWASLAAILVAVGLAATSVFNPAEAMVKNVNNIYGVTPKSVTGRLLPIINCIGLGIAFFIFATLQAFPHDPPSSSAAAVVKEKPIHEAKKKGTSKVAVTDKEEWLEAGGETLDEERGKPDSVQQRSLKIEDVIRWLEKNKLPGEAIEGLRAHAYFGEGYREAYLQLEQNNVHHLGGVLEGSGGGDDRQKKNDAPLADDEVVEFIAVPKPSVDDAAKRPINQALFVAEWHDD